MFAENGNLQDSDFHSGLARAAFRVTRGFQIESGGIATRARSDMRGAYSPNLAGNPANVAQLYSGYAGPTLAAQFVLAGTSFGQSPPPAARMT